jgi:hypothetical protein
MQNPQNLYDSEEQMLSETKIQMPGSHVEFVE